MAQPEVSPEDLKNLWHYQFTSHKPTAEGIRKIEGLRSAAKAMADAIIDMVPSGRDQALSLTNLEQMLFHANAGVARQYNEDLAPIPDEDKKPKDKEK